MKTMFKVVAGGLVLGTAAMGQAADTDLKAELEALKATVRAQQGEIQQLRAASGESWLNERRAEEVKGLIHEVLADAETRASLAEGGMTAGYRDHFFLASEDGNFLLQVQGQTQFRYIYNDTDDQTGVEHNEGFGLPRVKLGFYGHLFDPKFTYGVRGLFSDVNDTPFLTGSRDDGEFLLEEAWFAYEWADGWHIKGGQFKAPFLRDELVDSAHQQAVERAIVTDLFTTDYTQGVQVSYTTDQWRVAAMLHDGSYAANADWNDGDGVDFAVSGRGELLLAGNWSQFEDYAAFGDSTGILLGAAATYENAAGEAAATGITPVGIGANVGDVLKYTVDASVELPQLSGLNIFGAFVGLHNNEREAAQGDVDVYAAVVQAGVFVIPNKMDVFGRWEWIEASDIAAADDDDIHILTAGTNYYFRRHAAKATLDVIWTLEELPAGTVNDGLQGITDGAGEEDQFAVRAQFQFLF